MLLLKQGSHFGRPAQPYYLDSLAWLKENILGRRIKCELLRRDQYNRVVALPLLPRSFWPWRHSRRWWTPQGGSSSSATTTTPTTRNLPLEMVRAGWGAVYSQRGAEYGSDWEKEAYLAAEVEAQSVLFSFFQFVLEFSFFLHLLIYSGLGPWSGLRGGACGNMARTSSCPRIIKSDIASRRWKLRW